MKQIKLHVAAALLAAGMMPVAAMAGVQTATVNVTATSVAPSAVINVAGALAFGTVQDTATGTAQTSFDVTVSNSWPYSIDLDGGANYNAGTGQSFMQDGGGLNAREFAIYQDAGRLISWKPGSGMAGMTGSGSAQTYQLYGSLLAAAGTTGAISDIVTITVTY